MSESPIVEHVPAEYSGYIGEYFSVTRTQLDEAIAALAAADYAPLRTLGHILRGSAPAFGLKRLGEIGTRLEAAADARDDRHVDECVQLITAYLATATVIVDGAVLPAPSSAGRSSRPS